MNQKLFFLIMAFCISGTTGKAQMKMQIVSASNKAPLAYVSVINVSAQRTYASDANGNAKIAGSDGDTIRITHPGYSSVETRYEKSKGREFELSPEPHNETTRQTWVCKKERVITTSTPDTPGRERSYIGYIWGQKKGNSKIAVMVLPTVNAKLKSFSFWYERPQFATAYSYKGPVRIMFYEFDVSTGLPGKLITTQQVIHHSKKEGKQTVDVSTMDILIPETGIYISFEGIYTEKHAYDDELSAANDNGWALKSTPRNFGGALTLVRGHSGMAYYNEISESWCCTDLKKGTVKLEAVLAFCEE